MCQGACQNTKQEKQFDNPVQDPASQPPPLTATHSLSSLSVSQVWVCVCVDGCKLECDTVCVCVCVCAPVSGPETTNHPVWKQKAINSRPASLSPLAPLRSAPDLHAPSRSPRLALAAAVCVCACVCAVCARALTKMSGACVSERCHLGVVFSEGRQRNAAAALSPWHLVFLDTDTCVVCVWKAEQTCIVGMKNKNPVE